MKRIKKVWQENKVLLVLAIILIICLVIFGAVSMTYFYGTSDSVYGNRLDATKDVPIKDDLLKEIKETLKENEKVSDVTTNLKGIVLYINIKFVEKTKMDDAKNIAESSLDLFSEEELSTYDLEYTIISLSTDDVVGYTLMGAKNAGGSESIVWNNYNIEESIE